MSQQAKFAIGQVIHHRLFEYRGVIVDIDPTFQGSEQWYTQVAKSRPPKDQPWYHVLVDGSEGETYVAERNLELEENPQPIEHAKTDLFFSTFEDGFYRYRHTSH
uniref:Heat shock protein HspQ n=1 Tax=Magnetococcus massalia (strain MO-1) TaxID=451514 RepID=A0A1S7LFY8_MAGMO|nr:Hemimethylated DNA-binding region [Candidatus Magnetococcus massalia]